jgi:CRISPR-associated protein Cas1
VVQNRLKNERLEFYPHQIDHDSIVVDGHTGSITFDAIRWLMKHNISLTILNWNGNLLGVTLPKEPKSGKLKVCQYSKYLDSKTRFRIASEIVNAKVTCTINLLNELSRYYSGVNTQTISRLADEDKVLTPHNDPSNQNIKKSINQLMNYEGRIATAYWDSLAKIFNKLYPDFHFKSRKNKSYSWNMNASDEVNALLNYGYAVLESETRGAINASGLDPTIGFLHELAES